MREDLVVSGTAAHSGGLAIHTVRVAADAGATAAASVTVECCDSYWHGGVGTVQLVP